MNRTPDWLSWALLLALSLTWGTSYILIKKGLVVFSSLQLASLRITLSALAFLPVFIVRLPRIEWAKWRPLLIVGLAGSGFPAILFAIAQTRLSSSLTGILSAMTPLFTLLIGLLFFQIGFRWKQAVGVLIGLAGAIILVLFGTGSVASGNIWFALLVVLATACYALSSNTVKASLQHMQSLTISATAFVFIGPAGLILLLSTDFFSVMSHAPGAWAALGYVSILSLAGTVVASILFFRLVQLKDAVFASTVSYLIPVIALGWGLFDGEQVSYTHLAGLLLILAGLYLVRQGSRNSAP